MKTFAPSALTKEKILKWTASAVVATTGVVMVRFVHKAVFDPIHVIWDLDATIIASHLLPECKKKYPAEQYPDYFDQIDDDYPFEPGIANTRTWFRPYARFTMKLLSYFTVQHIFTAAQRTYTDNVTNALLEREGSNYFTVVKHRDLYPPKYLSKHGKNIYEIIGTENTRLLSRSIQFDDRMRYLQPHPMNGILVKEYKDVDEGATDKEMLKCLAIVLICHCMDDVRVTLKLLGWSCAD